ncbi:MCE family protein [Pseudonocardia sp. CA-107938]|uniref:MCE family protein n=1 Tax=Pseudonocardia sp. CA-107938 TaxID=3240021 RepID=UPI003D938CBA
MITTRMRVQLVVFMLIAAVGITYVGGDYAGLNRLFGTGGYRVTVQLADSGGIFENSEVAYRGVAVGRVEELRVTPGGVDAELLIDDSAPRIPAATRAVVANRSAIGEQYVDLRPDADTAPYLAEGSTIPVARTSLPPRAEETLASVDRLVTSVPVESLRTVVDELGTAFAGTGPGLQRLLDGAGALTATATEHLPQTTGLLADARTVLATQEQQSSDVLELSRGLQGIAEQLKESDPDLRRIIAAGPPVAGEVQELLRTSGSDLSVVIANLLTVSQVTVTRTDALTELLVAFPVINAFTPGTAPDGRGHLGLVLDFFDPPSCTRGYEGTVQRGADDFADVAVNSDVHCAEPHGSPTSVRGSQNAPSGGKVRAPATAGGSGQAPVAGQVPGTVGVMDHGGATTFAQLLGLP